MVESDPLNVYNVLQRPLAPEAQLKRAEERIPWLGPNTHNTHTILKGTFSTPESDSKPLLSNLRGRRSKKKKKKTTTSQSLWKPGFSEEKKKASNRPSVFFFSTI
jgi:hypothetical protein